MMNYRTALRYLDQHQNFEKKPQRWSSREIKLHRVRAALDALGSPETKYPSLLIAGTNAKGSLAYLLAAAFIATGYRTGLYVSPHVEDIRERIQINGKFIPKKSFAVSMQRIHKGVPPEIEASLTYFEILTVAAMDYFSRASVEVAILEVGLGGRLDATNVVTPLVSVIGPVSFDHERVLGSSLEAIAREKAGIIKQRGAVVISPQKPEAARAIRAEAKKKQAKLIAVSAKAKCPVSSLRLLGQHQKNNAAVVIRVLEIAATRGDFRFNLPTVRRALAECVVPARLEQLSSRPLIYLDGAHNAQALDQGLRTLRAEYPKKRIVLLFGFSKDKNLDRILEALKRHRCEMFLTKSYSVRGGEPVAFMTKAKNALSILGWSRDPKLAFRKCIKLLKPADLLLITGSFYLAGDLRRYIQRWEKSK